MSKNLWKYSVAGLLVLVPAWATFLILSTLFHALNELIHDLPWNIGARQSPGLSLVLFLFLVVMIGAIATHVRIGELMIIPQVALGVLAWLGLYLRDARLRALIPLRS